MSRPALGIAIVLPDLRLGGAQRVLLELAGQFHRLGHSVELISLVGDGELRRELPPGVDYCSLDCSPSGGFRLAASALPKLARRLRRRRPDAVISSMTGTNLITALAHGLAGSSGRLLLREAVSLANLRSRASRWLMRALYRRADALIAVSSGVAEDLRAIGIPDHAVHVVHNPIDQQRLERMAAEPLHPGVDAPYVVSVGRLIEQKDHATLLHAFAASRLRLTHKLVLVGGGEARSMLEGLSARLGLDDRILFTGALSNPFPLLRGAALFVLSSRWEGYPNVLLEALALGVPVVATDCPAGPREMLKGGALGRLVPVGDARALAEAMDAELASPARDRQSVLIEHDPQRVAARYLQLLLPVPPEHRT